MGYTLVFTIICTSETYKCSQFSEKTYDGSSIGRISLFCKLCCPRQVLEIIRAFFFEPHAAKM